MVNRSLGHPSWKNDCTPAVRGGSWICRTYVHCVPVAYPSTYFEGKTRTHQDPLQEAYSPPQGFDGGDGRRLLVRHVNEVERARRSAPPLLTTPTAHSMAYTLRCRSGCLPLSPLSFISDADVDSFQERNILRRRGMAFRWYHRGLGTAVCSRFRCRLARAGRT